MQRGQHEHVLAAHLEGFVSVPGKCLDDRALGLRARVSEANVFVFEVEGVELVFLLKDARDGHAAFVESVFDHLPFEVNRDSNKVNLAQSVCFRL